MKYRLSERTSGISTNVNLLKFICAILVIVCHGFALTGSQLDPWQKFTGGDSNFGGIAVPILFFFSGFYITKSLYRVKNSWEFMKKRCIRIFPQLWITVLLCIFVLGVAVTTIPISKYLTSMDTYLYLLNGIMIPIHNLPGVFQDGVNTAVNGSLWTMPVEFACYIGLTILWLFNLVFKDEKRQPVLQKILHILAVCFFAAVLVILRMVVEDSGFITSVICPFILFFEGSLYWDYREKIVLDIRIVIAFIVTFFVMSANGLFYLGVILLLPYIVLGITLLPSQLKIKTDVLNISYEMYLLGFPIQQALFWLSGNKMTPWSNIAATIPIDIILAYILYKSADYMVNKLTAGK